jgi:hypothetical protein
MTFAFSGFVVAVNNLPLLVYGPEVEVLAALGTLLVGPALILRPGYHLFFEPDYLLPEEVIDDRGQRFAAPECYEWIETHGDLFPRADAIGVRPSGQPQTVFLKALDLTDMAVFAAPETPTSGASYVRIEAALEARSEPASRAFEPAPFPIPLLDRALISYRLTPSAANLERLLASIAH